MPRKKLIRYQQIKNFNLIFEYIPGKENAVSDWKSFFNNDHPIEIELGCGNGDFCVEYALKNPDINIIGVDIKGHRLWQAAQKAIHLNLKNIAFIRTQIQFVEHFFKKNCIPTLWMFFPDPQLGRKETTRITHQKYLKKYSNFLSSDNLIHFKTDSDVLYQFTLHTIQNLQLPIIFKTSDLLNEINVPHQAIFTETKFGNLNISGSNTIFYIAFKLEHSRVKEGWH